AEDYVHRIGRTGRAGASGLAITLVSRDDSRLVDDIEKLIKKKIEIEPLELEDDAPRRPYRDRQQHDASGEGRSSARDPGRREATSRPGYREPARPPADPFFDKPYEPSDPGAEPAWEKRSSVPTGRGLSPNIKPKKKVAALFGTKLP